MEQISFTHFCLRTKCSKILISAHKPYTVPVIRTLVYKPICSVCSFCRRLSGLPERKSEIPYLSEEQQLYLTSCPSPMIQCYWSAKNKCLKINVCLPKPKIVCVFNFFTRFSPCSFGEFKHIEIVTKSSSVSGSKTYFLNVKSVIFEIKDIPTKRQKEKLS